MSMLLPNRGEVWRVNLDPTLGHEQGGTRPCLVVSHDKFNHGKAELVIVLPLTRTDRGIPSHVRIEPPEGGLPAASFIKCEEVRCISRARLHSQYGRVSEATILRVETLLRTILAL